MLQKERGKAIIMTRGKIIRNKRVLCVEKINRIDHYKHPWCDEKSEKVQLKDEEEEDEMTAGVKWQSYPCNRPWRPIDL
jgi:hypothetical protein